MFFSWVISIGSLATLQEVCHDFVTASDGVTPLGTATYSGVRGFSATVLPCTKVRSSKPSF